MRRLSLATHVPSRIGLIPSLVLFGIPGWMLWFATTRFLPRLVDAGWPRQLAWFAAGSTVFVPICLAAIVGAWLSLDRPTLRGVLAQLRVRPMSRSDWKLSGIVLVAVLLATGVLFAINESLWPRKPPNPPFLQSAALKQGELYLLLWWVPFFTFNIVGEEFWWRGFIQTRQEPIFGRYTWLLQGLLHWGFHVSFGPGLLFILLPIVFAIPWIVQRTGNTTTGIVVHGGINGPGFLAVSLGLG